MYSAAPNGGDCYDKERQLQGVPGFVTVFPPLFALLTRQGQQRTG